MKQVKTRKEHDCGYCHNKIESGSLAIFEQWRQAKYNTTDEQVGIEYMKFWFCVPNCSE